MTRRMALGLLLLLAAVSAASADIGIGLKWAQESAVVPQDAVSCITYGLYNPFDSDVDGSLAASQELSPLVSPTHSDGPLRVPKGTAPESSLQRRICFSIPQAYPPGGLGPLFPSQSCPPDSERKSYTGEVSARSEPVGGRAGGVGSATGTAVAAPLRLIVGCVPSGTDFATPADLALYAVLALTAAGLVRRYRKPPEVRRREKAERLKRQLEKLQTESGEPGKSGEAGPPKG
jgi:hypothetical protein